MGGTNPEFICVAIHPSLGSGQFIICCEKANSPATLRCSGARLSSTLLPRCRSWSRCGGRGCTRSRGRCGGPRRWDCGGGRGRAGVVRCRASLVGAVRHCEDADDDGQSNEGSYNPRGVARFVAINWALNGSIEIWITHARVPSGCWPPVLTTIVPAGGPPLLQAFIALRSKSSFRARALVRPCRHGDDASAHPAQD
jgi:hypothetical protein